MNYISISQASEKWRITQRRIQVLCSQDRIPGAFRMGYIWAIPSNAKKPKDARIKNGKYVRKNNEAK